MSTDGDLTYSRRGQSPVRVKVKGSLRAEDWKKFQREYAELARGYGLEIVSTVTRKKPAKKATTKRKSTTKKSTKRKSK